MSKAFDQIALAVSSTVAATVSVLILKASGIAFPMALSTQAWPQWLIFCALVFCAMSVMTRIVELLSRRLLRAAR